MPRTASVYAAGAWRTVQDLHVYASDAWKRVSNAWVYSGQWLLFHALQTPDWLQDWSGNANHLTGSNLEKIQDQASEIGAYPTDDAVTPHMLLLDDPEHAFIAIGDINSPKLKGGFNELTVAFWYKSVSSSSGDICGTWAASDPDRIWKIVLENSGLRVRVWYFDQATGNPGFMDHALAAGSGNGTWYLVVVKFDFQNPTASARIQVASWESVGGWTTNVLTSASPPQQALPTSQATDFHVGQDASGGTATPTINLGELAIYDDALWENVFDETGEDWAANGLPIGTVLNPDSRLIAGYRWRSPDFVEDPGTPPPTIQPPSNPTAEALNTSEIRVTAEVHTDTSDGVRVYWKAGSSMLGDPVENSDGFEDLAVDANDLAEGTIDGLTADTDYFFQFAGTIDAGGPNEEIGTNYTAEIEEATLAPGGGGDVTGLSASAESISRIRWTWINPDDATDIRCNLWDESNEQVLSDASLGVVEAFERDGSHGVRAAQTWRLEVWAIVGGSPTTHAGPLNGTSRNLNAPTIVVDDNGSGSFRISIDDAADGEDRFEVEEVGVGPIPGSPFSGGGDKVVTHGPFAGGTSKTYRARAAGDTADGPYQTGAWSNQDGHTIPNTAPSPLTIDVTALSPWQVNIDVSGGLPCSSWELRRGVGVISDGADWDAVPVVQSNSGERPGSFEDPQGGQLSPGETYTWRLTATNDGLDTHSNVDTLTMTAVTPDVLSQQAREQTTQAAGYRADCVFHVNSAAQSARILWSEWDENSDVVRTRQFLQDMDVSPNGGPYVSNLVNSGQCHFVKFFIQLWNQDNQQGDMIEESAPAGSEAKLVLNNFGADNCEPFNA